MQVVIALRALVDGIVRPERIKRAMAESAISIFSVAVLILTAADTAATYYEAADPSLRKESASLVHAEKFIEQEGSLDISDPGKQFTAIMGGALIRAIVSLLVLSAVALGIARFLTDGTYSTGIALASVSAASGIEVLRSITETASHLMFHTARAGLHAGAFVDPLTHPFLFSWLQRFDVFGFWFYISFAVAMASWEGLHRKYGFVIGASIFAFVQAVFAVLTFLSWIVTGPL